jgi:hypothetical protein
LTRLLDALRSLAVWSVRHRRVFPVDVKLHALLGKQGLQALSQLLVSVAVTQEGGLLKTGADLRFDNWLPLSSAQQLGLSNCHLISFFPIPATTVTKRLLAVMRANPYNAAH